MLTDNVDIFASILTDIFNDYLKKGMFADELKLADISPIFKSIEEKLQTNQYIKICVKAF